MNAPPSIQQILQPLIDNLIFAQLYSVLAIIVSNAKSKLGNYRRVCANHSIIVNDRLYIPHPCKKSLFNKLFHFFIVKHSFLIDQIFVGISNIHCLKKLTQ